MGVREVGVLVIVTWPINATDAAILQPIERLTLEEIDVRQGDAEVIAVQMDGKVLRAQACGEQGGAEHRDRERNSLLQ